MPAADGKATIPHGKMSEAQVDADNLDQNPHNAAKAAAGVQGGDPTLETTSRKKPSVVD